MANAKSELYELSRIGATPQKNSGRGKFAKGDGILGPFCVDVKEAIKSFTLNRAVWAKITGDARQSGNLSPALKVTIGAEGETKQRVMIIDETMFNELYKAWVFVNETEEFIQANEELLRRLANGD